MVNRIPQYNRVADMKRLKFICTTLDKEIEKGGYVLDVGCGNGIISHHLGALGYKVKGIDVSEDAINKAKKQNSRTNVEFEVINAEKNHYPLNTYDAIICSEVLEHLEKPHILLKQLNTALKENGVLIVTVPNGMGPREVLVTKPVQRIYQKKGFILRILKGIKKLLGYSGTTIQSDADNLDHIQFFTRKQLQVLSNNNGFEITSLKKSNFIDDVFPFSLLTKRIKLLQKIDSKIADLLPHYFTGGFLMIWRKKNTI